MRHKAQSRKRLQKHPREKPCALLLRPTEKAHTTQALLATHNVECIHVPMVRFAQQRGALNQQEVNAFQHLVFVSTTAVDMFAQQYRFPQNACYWAVGARTKAQLANKALTNAVIHAHTTQPTSIETLTSALLPQLTENTSVLLVAGTGGRKYLAHALRAHTTVHYRKLSVYKPIAIEHEYTMLERACRFCTIILVHSIALLNTLIDNITRHKMNAVYERLYGLAVIVASERIAHAARLHGFRHVLVAHSASDSDMLACVRVAYRTPHAS